MALRENGDDMDLRLCTTVSNLKFHLFQNYGLADELVFE